MKKKSKAPIIIIIVVVLVAAIGALVYFTNGFGLFGGGNDTPGGGVNDTAGGGVNDTTGGGVSTPGGNNNTTGGNNNSGTSPTAAPDLGAAIGGSMNLFDADPATRQALIDEARRQGGDLEFRTDGSVVYTDPDGSVLIQKPDGSWVYQDEDGNSTSAQFGGDWPENEFTKLLPKPNFTLTAALGSDSEFTVLFQDAAIEQIRAYVEQAKSAGFTVDVDVTDEAVMGMEIYTFEAKNSAGYKLSIYAAMGTSGLTIAKP